MRPVNLYLLTRDMDKNTYTEFENILSARKERMQVKEHEFGSLRRLVDILQEKGVTIAQLDGFFYSYTIRQIGKEFDLLKIDAPNRVLNIELKSMSVTEEKIERQLLKNKYYLGTLADRLDMYTYVEETDSLYTLQDNVLKKAEFSELVCAVKSFSEYGTDNPDKLLQAKNYLISPLNMPKEFLEGRYFLTQQQEMIKKNICDSQSLKSSGTGFWGITGIAGTGKTLLMYDLAKEMSKNGRVLMIHCGMLSEGHRILNEIMENVDIISEADIISANVNVDGYQPQAYYVPGADSIIKHQFILVDECHRSQFGKMHGQIQKHFERANYIGFTGTPIFEKNKGADGRTTADVFYAGDKLDSCLHKYMIKDAIADGNVLRFSVEYQRTIFAKKIAVKGLDPEQLDDPDYCKRHRIDMEPLYHDDERIADIAKHIMEHHEQHVHPQGKDIYTALFAVDKIQTLGKYYDEFKKLNDAAPENRRLKVAAIFSYQANEDMDDGADEHSQELLDRCIRDYNDLYGTVFKIDTFDAYRKDIANRLKQKVLPQIDILLVVNMFLTGFDAKPLNTLYLDKNLVWHSLVQAYSRTNRVDKVTKQFGHIVSYRNIKRWQDEALTLFSGDGDPNEYLLEDYEYYVNQWKNQEHVLRKIAPDIDAAGQLKSEDEIRMFIIGFRSMAKTLSTLKTFLKFKWNDLADVMDENEYEGFKSWYLYYKDQTRNPNPKVPVPVDVDFDIELVRTDRINVVYILNLLKNATTHDKTEEEKQQDVDLILREIERSDNESLRLKKEVMKQFILTRFYDLPEDADVMEAFTQFEKEQMKADMEVFAFNNKIDCFCVSDIFCNYVFNGTISDDVIRKRLKVYKLGLLEMTKLTKSVKTFVRDTYNKYKAEDE